MSLLVGLLGGVGSALLTQYLASRREAAARSYEHRRDAYVDFITGFYEQWEAINETEVRGYPHGDPPDEYFKPSYDRLIQIQIFGTVKAADLAEKAVHALHFGSKEPSGI